MQSEAPAVTPDQQDSYVAQARAVAGLREHPFTPRLKEISVPVLVVGGGQDGTAGAGGSVILARNLQNAHLEVCQDAGHGVFRNKREEFRRLALGFLKENSLIS